MIFTDLRIRLMDYGPSKGKHVGEAKFSDETGNVTLTLNDHHVEEIFRVCADSIVEVSRAAARHMTARVIKQQQHSQVAARLTDHSASEDKTP